MEVNEAAQWLYSLTPDEPMVGISNVAKNMAERRLYYKKAGFEQFDSFALSYHFVTTKIEDQVSVQKTLGGNYFRQPQVLDTAIGIFDHKFASPFKRQIEGKPVPVHWNIPMNHELMQYADKGIQAAVGYVCHITSRDLPETVYQTERTGLYSPRVMSDYIKHDYNRIDDSLARSAQKIAPLLIESSNPKTRDAMVKLAMGGIILGRKLARRDYRRLAKARSDDERESIMDNADNRAAKLALFILDTSYSYRGLKDQLRAAGTVPKTLKSAA